MDMKGWSVACVVTGKEDEVCHGLARLDVSYYSPMCRIRSVRRGTGGKGGITRSVAAWPGYVLIDEATIKDQNKIERLAGFHYFLVYPWTGHKKVIKNSIVEALKAKEAEGVLTLDEVREAMWGVPEGAEVRVTTGLMQGYTGIVGKIRRGYGEFKADGQNPILISIECLEVIKS